MISSSFVPRSAAAALSAILATLIFTTAGAARRPRPKFRIKFATLAPDGSTWMKTMHAIDDELRVRTENRVGLKFYPGGVQGDEKDVLRKIRNGQLHAGGFTGFGLGAIVPESRVQELPFLFKTPDEIDHLRDGLDSYFDAKFSAKGYINLGWVDVGAIYIFSNQPIRSPADMTKARMWIWSGDPLAELFFKAFGISPIPLSAPDVLTSLQTGIINAVYSSPLACMALQWYTRVHYMTDVPITYGIGAVLVSKKALARMNPGDVAILREVAAPKLRQLALKTRTQNQEAIEEMKKEGIQIVPVSPEVRHSFFTTGRAAWKDGVGKLYPADLLARVEQFVSNRHSPK